MDAPAKTEPIDRWPLSRLQAALSYAERAAGSDSATARVLARIIRERTASDQATPHDTRPEGDNA